MNTDNPLSLLVKPLVWLYRIVADQTRLTIDPQSAEGRSETVVPVPNNRQFLFSLGTRSKGNVELVRVEVQFASPLQVFDPGNLGFFVSTGSYCSEYPYCLLWEGTASVRRDLLQAFAVHVVVPLSGDSFPLKIVVHARRRHKALGGFSAQGRLQVTSKELRVCASAVETSLRVPPLSALTSPQQYLVQSAISGWSESPDVISVTTHSLDTDGRAESKTMQVPGR